MRAKVKGVSDRASSDRRKVPGSHDTRTAAATPARPPKSLVARRAATSAVPADSSAPKTGPTPRPLAEKAPCGRDEERISRRPVDLGLRDGLRARRERPVAQQGKGRTQVRAGIDVHDRLRPRPDDAGKHDEFERKSRGDDRENRRGRRRRSDGSRLRRQVARAGGGDGLPARRRGGKRRVPGGDVEREEARYGSASRAGAFSAAEPVDDAPHATGTAKAARTARSSRVDFPVVTTSSTTATRSPGSRANPRRKREWSRRRARRKSPGPERLRPVLVADEEAPHRGRDDGGRAKRGEQSGQGGAERPARSGHWSTFAHWR